MTAEQTQGDATGSDLTESAIREHLKTRPATVVRIARFLFNRYISLIDMRDLESRPLAERIDKFLTRTLAAHAVVAHLNVDEAEAGRCVVDGGQDLGIDAIAFDYQQKRSWLVQSKFAQGGQGQIPWDELARFLEGFESIVSDSYGHANRKILAMRESISRAVTEVSWKFTLVLASTSANPLAEHDLKKIHEKLEYQDPGNMGTFTFENFSLNLVTASVGSDAF